MMTTPRILVALAVASALASCGCGKTDEGGSHSAAGGNQPGASVAGGAADVATPAPLTKADRLMVGYIEEFEKMAEALQNVNDESSAKAAGKTISEIAQRIQGREGEWEGIGEAEVAASSERYAEKVQQIQAKLGQAAASVMTNPEYAQHIQSEMKDMPHPKGN